MSKINPVMKHAKSKEQIGMEEFLEGVPDQLEVQEDMIVDNSVQEWVDSPVMEREEIIAPLETADELDSIASDVDVIKSVSALESYHRIYQYVVKSQGLQLPVMPSVESFDKTVGGKKALAKTIRDHAMVIRNCVQLGLEDYVDQVERRVEETMANYKQGFAKLDKLKSEVSVSDKPINIDHNGLWEMFHINDEFIEPRDIEQEITAVTDLANMVHQATPKLLTDLKAGKPGESYLPKKEFRQLMFNTDVTIKGDKVSFIRQRSPQPKKEWAASQEKSLKKTLILWGYLGLGFKLLTEGKQDIKTDKVRGKNEMMQMIDKIKSLQKVMSQMETDVKSILSVIDGLTTDQAAAKKAASPVLELAAQLVKHVGDVTYGATVLFDRVAKANTVDKK